MTAAANPPRTSRVSTVTPVLEPVRVASADDLAWDDTADVIVVGWGAAGACAALEARASGADVLVLDRFSGGGASALSGGVVYAGGGTPQQREAGFDDSAEAMAAYLRHEVADVVSDATLQRFCADSVGNLAWLEAQGVRFAATTAKHKTSYPPAGIFLYYSGNEVVPAYRSARPVSAEGGVGVVGAAGASGANGPTEAIRAAEAATPAPRGHRAVSNGQSGAALMDALQRATQARGARCRTQAAVRRLVVEQGSGRVLGVQAWCLPAGHAATRRHAELDQLIPRWRLYQPGRADAARREQAALEQQHAQPLYLRAQRAVVLSTGGHVYNPALMKQHAPAFRPGWPIGGAGCDGSGLRLGESVGAASRHLDNVSAWRFITPPYAWPKGLVVNAQGRRFCNEQVYGATLGHEMMSGQGGRAWLLLDRPLFWQSVRECLFARLWAFQSLPALMLLFKLARKAPTLSALAACIGADAEALRAEVERANAAARGECDDPLGKSADMRHEFGHGPWFAIDISITQRLFPLAILTLGGLRVNEHDGHVVDGQGNDIPGLFAAGRSAVGLASRRYVSGLSLADCVFSGRRAGRAAAAQCP